MDLSIAIVNWKSAELCVGCIASIYAAPFCISHEIVVIDNASFDGCESLLSRRFPGVRFLQNRANAGFAGANNLAFAYTTGAVVCFLNPDTIVQGAALQILYDALNGIVDAGAVGALLFNNDGSPQDSCVLPFPTILNQAFDIAWLRRRFPRAGLFGAAAIYSDQELPQAVEAVSGACIMMHRSLFIEISMFSTEYFMYAEDIDLCRKVIRAGRKVYLINAAHITHYGGGSSKEQKDRLLSAVLTRESNYRLLIKFRGHTYALLYRLSVSAMGLMRIAALLLCLPPAVGIGRARTIVDMLRRWWHLLMWSVGVKQAPQPCITRTPDA